MPKLVNCFVLLNLCVLCGCYTEAGDYNFAKEQKIDKPKQLVWQKTVEFFAVNNINIKTIDKTSDIIAGEKLADSKIADCGISDNEAVLDKEEEDDVQRPMMTFNVYLKAQGDKATNVGIHATVAKTQAFRPMDGDTDVMCASKGVLEKQIFEYLEK